MSEDKEYFKKAKTVEWMMKEKGFQFLVAVKCVANKHGLVASTLEAKVREIVEPEFFAQRRRDAQKNWVAPSLVDECNDKQVNKYD